ncbi:hypothetical protein ACWGQ2_12385 [Arthrobacter sp. NPDC055585]
MAGIISIAADRTTSGLSLQAAGVVIIVCALLLGRRVRLQRRSSAATALDDAVSPPPSIGRAAGVRGPAEGEDPRVFLAALTADSSHQNDPRPSLLAVADDDLSARLEQFGPVVHLAPGLGAPQVSQGPHRALVIDRRALKTGRWAGVETAAAGSLFRELAEIIRKCQEEHVSTLLLDCAAEDGFYTPTLREICRNVMPLQAGALGPEGTAPSDLLGMLQEWSEGGNVHAR